ncbi:MAG: hypothetical protein BWZ10_02059 [candidate division BRC1 bacterium ADurb.BinA364]|nr:MAG: hypothetical protein BWZ10_02059 [candidate division BRC1 bacterium ADurb.BinA364]
MPKRRISRGSSNTKGTSPQTPMAQAIEYPVSPAPSI